MKRISKYILLISAALVITQCRKDAPGTYVTYSEDVVFSIKGSLAGIPFEHHAGEEGYVMNSNYELQDSVVELRGALLPNGNINKSGFEIKLRGQQKVANLATFDPAKNIVAGQISLRDATGFRNDTGVYVVSLGCDTTVGQYASHLWIFPDGTYSSAYNLEKEVSYSEYPEYPVRLVTSGTFSCQSEVYHEINLKDGCDAGFDVEIFGLYTAIVSLKNVQGNIDLVKWFLNDTLVTPSAFNNSFFLGNTGEPHLISCKVYFTNGCVKTMERVIGANFATNCQTDFHYQSRKLAIFDPQQRSTVEIIYYDDNGKKYSSYYANAQGQFELISYSPYLENQNGDATMMIDFEANAILKSADGSSLELTNVKGSFALAHP